MTDNTSAYAEFTPPHEEAIATEDLAEENRFLSITPSGKLGWQMHDINPQGAAGDATLATAEKGAAVLDHVGRRFVQLLQEVDRFPLERLANQPAWQ